MLLCLPVANVLRVVAVGGRNLTERDGQVLILIGSEMSSTVNGTAADFLGIVLVEYCGGITPAHEIKEALALHTHFQTAFHLHNLHSLVLGIAAAIVADVHFHAIGIGIAGNHLGAGCCT